VDAAREGISEDELDLLCSLTRRAHRTATMSARYEDVRGLMASWRWFHRWLALLMVLLVAIHVVAAMRFGEVDWAAVFPLGRKP
jgi:cytochrome b561